MYTNIKEFTSKVGKELLNTILFTNYATRSEMVKYKGQLDGKYVVAYCEVARGEEAKWDDFATVGDVISKSKYVNLFVGYEHLLMVE